MLMFRVGSAERLKQMQAGLLYMNSAEYFATFEGDAAMRGDPFERVYSVHRAGHHSHGFSSLELAVGEGDARKVVDLGDKAVVTVLLPKPKNVMLFCMTAVGLETDGDIATDSDGKIYFSERFVEFGDTVLLINNLQELFDRIGKVIGPASSGTYGSQFFEGGYGFVDYIDLTNHSGNRGVFRKDTRYSWQREFRIYFGVKDEFLNARGAFELQVGDLSDITKLVPVSKFLAKPVTVTRRAFKRVGGKFVQVPMPEK
jgi:hypothetical protein